MAKTYLFFVGLVGALLLSGCDGGSSSNSTTNSGSTSSSSSSASTSAQPTNVRQAVDQAIAAGELPLLDTSNSIAGPDADHNGVRDDIDAYINKLNYTAPQKSALRQFSASMTTALAVDVTSDASVVAANAKMARATNCLSTLFDDQVGMALLQEVEEYNSNTPNRTAAYLKYAKALNGKMLQASSGDTCDGS